MNGASERILSLKVADVMCRELVVLPVAMTLAEAASVLTRHSVSAAPVVDAEGCCIGLISATDFLRCNASDELDSLAPASGTVAGGQTLAPYMSTAVQSISENESLLAAATIMNAQHVHRLMVLDDQEKPRGVISTMDIVSALVNAVDEMKLRLKS